MGEFVDLEKPPIALSNDKFEIRLLEKFQYYVIKLVEYAIASFISDILAVGPPRLGIQTVLHKVSLQWGDCYG